MTGRLSENVNFVRGASLYAAGQFWEAHEAWEIAWRVATDANVRLLLQAFIQITAALFKIYERHDRESAARIFARAVVKLEELPDIVDGLDITRFRIDAEACRDVLEHGQDGESLSRTRIPKLP